MPKLPQESFAVGMAQLERYYHRKLHPNDREAYYRVIQNASAYKWEKCVEYAMGMSKGMPKASELREWMGLPELLAPLVESDGFRPGTIHGLTPSQLIDLVKRGEDLPFPDPWKDKLEELCYLDVPWRIPPPAPGTLSQAETLAWIRRYAEQAAADYEEQKPKVEAI